MIREEKKRLRNWVRTEKKLHSGAECTVASNRLWQFLEQDERFKKAHSILLYYSLKDEVATHDFVERWASEKEIWLPVVNGEELELHRYTGRESLHVGAYDIEEPNGPLIEHPETIELAIIPGMSFDCHGHRLGRGKGYYDRLLPQLTAYTIGVCYHFQVTEEVPCEPFDRSMNAVLTDEGWL